MESTLQPMRTSQVLDRTFSLYRKNFVLFAGLAVLPPACLLLGELLFFSLILSGIGKFSDPTAAAVVGFAMFGAVVVLVPLWMAAYDFAAGGSTFAVWRLHLGLATTIRESFKFIKSFFWRILGIQLLTGVAILFVAGIGVVAVTVTIGVFSNPARAAGAEAAVILLAVLLGGSALALLLFVYARLSVAIAVCVVEKRGVIDSLQRSVTLTQGTVWRIVLVLLLAFVLTIALSAVFSLIPYILSLFLMFANGQAKGKESLVFLSIAVKYLGDFVASTISYPIATIAISLIYFDQRVRMEAYDLQYMMEVMETAVPAPQDPVPQAPTPNIE
jgi:hypothetical protein